MATGSAGAAGQSGSSNTGVGEKCGSDPATEDSSESDGDAEPAKPFHRRVSTSKAIKNGVCIKEGMLTKQTSSFQRWKKRYFRLKPRKLYYAKDSKSVIFEEIDLTELSVAECSTKNANHSFQIITPFRRLILCAETRKEMEEWISALKSVTNKDFYEGTEHHDFLSGQHNWYVTSHARPTYCNVCKEALSGVTSHGLSCEVCKFKAHKKCAVKSPNNCKWTTLASVGKDIIEDEDGVITMPHQWMEGNLPVSAKCSVCDKTCGSVLRLQDWRCLWCRAMAHTPCKQQHPVRCPLGSCRSSIVPPTALHSTGGTDDAWEPVRLPGGCTPLLVFVNSKSGDNQGVRFIRRFKQLLNPAQVFDLMNGGPGLGLRMFRGFSPLRVLVCAGDGSVSWVLSEMDRLRLHGQCQTGVLPLGTGNDLARVLGWGSVCDDDAQLPQLLDKYGRASARLLDRWSIMTYEGTMPLPRKLSAPYDQISVYEDSVVTHLSKILHSDKHSVVISSAKVLCETVKDFIAKVGAAADSNGNVDDKDSISHKCKVLNEKLDSLLKTLQAESLAVQSNMETKEKILEEEEEKEAQESERGDGAEEMNKDSGTEKQYLSTPCKKSQKTFIQREALMLRANSLKKAVRQIIEHTERAVDEQNAQTEVREADAEQKSHQQYSPRKETSHRTYLGNDPLIEETQVQEERPDVPVLTTTFHDDSSADDVAPSSSSSSSAGAPCWDPWGIAMGQSVGASLKDTLQVTLPTIEGGRSTDSSPCPSPRSLTLTPTLSASPCSPSPISMEEQISHPSSSPLHNHPAQHPTTLALTSSNAEEQSSGGKEHPASPTASRRISSGSTLKHIGNIGLQLGSGTGIPLLAPGVVTGGRMRDRSPDEGGGGGGGGTTVGTRRKSFPIINPLASLPMWPNLNRESLVGKVLLANADALCAAASPLMDVETVSLDDFDEKCVMNNYFGIGLDAKITLEFHNKREEHPEKCRSRTKNLMWYGVLGGKELLQRTYKNLEQRVQLECDGHRIALPSLQGIVVLNIPSYGGGSNFWGGSKEDDVFYAPAIDDKILEVVAVFGTVQMAASRVINLQHHRIAQCRSVRITITGDEGVPVQVDGEAWVQPPGCICIVHKNRTQILCRNRQYESTVKQWQERQRHLAPRQPRGSLTEDEAQQLTNFVEATASLVRAIKVSSISHPTLEQELFPAASQASSVIDRLFPGGRMLEGPHVRHQINDLVATVRQLFQDTKVFIAEKLDEAKLRPDLEDKLLSTASTLEEELKKCFDLQGTVHFLTGEDEQQQEQKGLKGIFKLKFMRKSTSSSPASQPPPLKTEHSLSISSGTAEEGGGAGLSPSLQNLDSSPCKGSHCGTPTDSPQKKISCAEEEVHHWSAEEVGMWLAKMQLKEYQENFMQHDIQGAELLSLERRDLKELGVTKVGHIKRILQGVANIKSATSITKK
ncbi:diacylglycerol kinase eta-like [Ornithodoros turicata]|uniref:diacylglycerol kinase eta-like n=1 Tax=Ornithodoros turicata TaxID=34597 RepID=UPI003138D821